MSLEIRKVHEFAKQHGSDQWSLVRTNPILRLGRAGGDGNTSVLMIQRGVAYTEGGLAVKQKDLPAWFNEEISKCSPEALADCGWKSPSKGD